jgi:hypothetical protein
MSTQPEALRLADVSRLSRHHEWHLQVDDELRRLCAENERLAAEVANRNRRALAGDEAVSALANVHAYYEGLEAQRDALLEACKAYDQWADKTLCYDRVLRPIRAQIRAAIKAVEGEKT